VVCYKLYNDIYNLLLKEIVEQHSNMEIIYMNFVFCPLLKKKKYKQR